MKFPTYAGYCSFSCVRESGDVYCGEIFQKIVASPHTKVPPLGTGSGHENCLIFDIDVFKNGNDSIPQNVKSIVDSFCGVSAIIVLCIFFLPFSPSVPSLSPCIIKESNTCILHT